VSRSVVFLAWAFVLSPTISVLVAVGLLLAGVGEAVIPLLFALPALMTVVAALRTERANWVIAVTPVLSAVLAGCYLVSCVRKPPAFTPGQEGHAVNIDLGGVP
jgi:hypothetical protein